MRTEGDKNRTPTATAAVSEEIRIDSKTYDATKVVIARFLGAFKDQRLTNILLALKTRNRPCVAKMMEKMEAEEFVIATGNGRNEIYTSGPGAITVNLRTRYEVGALRPEEEQHMKASLRKAFWKQTDWVKAHLRVTK